MRNKSKKKLFNKKIYKFLFPTIFSATSLGLVTIFTSCSPSKSVIDNLLYTDDRNKFVNSNFDLNKVASLSLSDRVGYESYLQYKIGEVLIKWYENNKEKRFVEKLSNLRTQIDQEWSDLVSRKKASYGNSDYVVYLQTENLDKYGGTLERWKKNKLINLVIDDFFNELFAKDYLWYYRNENTQSRDIISSEELNNPNNWINLKFQAIKGDEINQGDQYYDSGVAESFALLQEKYFDFWVENKLPLLTSYIFFPPNNPAVELKNIFDKTFFPNADLGSPTYNFQVFADSRDAHIGTNSQKEYETNTVQNLSKYFDKESHGINFETWDSSSDTKSGKMISLVDLFDSEDITFSSGIITLLSNKLGNQINIPTSEANNREGEVDNIMKNFIFNGGESVKSGTFRNKQVFISDALSEKINEPTMSYYKDIYSRLFSDNGSIADIVKPNFTDNTDQFIFIRNSSGVYILAIDGLNYFTNDNGGFNTEKLKSFLKYRSVQKSCHYDSLKDKANDVEFEILSNVRKYAESSKFNQFNLLLKVLMNEVDLFSNSTEDIDSFKTFVSETLYEANEETKTSFQVLQNSYERLVFYSNCIFSVDVIREKYLTRFKTYSNYLSSSKVTDAGMYSNLPFVVNFGVEQAVNLLPEIEKLFSYQVNKFWWNDLASSKPGLFDYSALKSSSENVKKEIIQNAQNYVENLNFSKLENVADSNFKYSQSLFTDNLGIDNSINSYLVNSSTDFKNTVRIEKYLKDGLKDFYDTDSGVSGTTNYPILNSAITNTYKLTSLMSNYSTTILPWKNNFSTDLDSYINTKWESMNSSKFNYFSFLYTVKYLLSPIDSINGDTTPRLKTYLQNKISVNKGAGYEIWLSPTDQEDTDFSLEQLFKMPNNPNYIFGDLDNSFIYSGSDIKNTKKDAYNKLKSPFRSAKFKESAALGRSFGYLGLITDETYKNLPNAVLNKINKESSLYSFGNKDELKKFIDSLSSLSEIRNCVKNLSQMNDSIDWFSLALTSNSIGSVKEKIKTNIDEYISDSSFASKNGYFNEDEISENPVAWNAKTYINANDDSNLPGYYYGYVKMINFVDVNNIDSDWRNKQESRINMDLESFIQVACDLAMNSTEIQNDAITHLIYSSGGRIQIYDDRINVDSDNIWFYKEKRGNI